MALVTKNDVTQIFAIQAPEVDLPPTFANYPRGWDTARTNNGKPTIKQFNFIQQRTDQNVLWIHQNGAALPYDAAMEYAVGVVTLKDGRFKQWNGTIWVNFGQDDSALKIANNLSDVPNKATSRTNLEVYSKIEVDDAISSAIPSDELLYMPIPYPKSTPPTGYLVMMGQNISQVTYPKLYGLYGAVLPDLRAYTIRGLDNGRGVDTDRIILSEQEDAIRNITGTIARIATDNLKQTTGVFAETTVASNVLNAQTAGSITSYVNSFDASRVVPVASENRVKNIAFLYIVKAG